MTFTISQIPSSLNLYIYPTSDSITNFTPSTGSNHYSLIDDIWNSPDISDYVYMSEVATKKDRFGLTNHTSETGTINYVRLIAYAKGSFSSTAPTLKLHTYLSATEDEESAQTLTATFSKYYETFTQDPSAGSWSWTDIDNVLAGFKGEITAKEVIYKTGDDTPSEELADMRFADDYLIVRDDTILRAYTYTYDATGNLFSLTEVDTHDVSSTAGYDINTYYNAGEDVIYIAWCCRLVSSNDLRLYLIKFDCATETFSTVAYDEEFGIAHSSYYVTCHQAFIDADYIYSIWSSKAASPGGQVQLAVYSYDSSSMTQEDRVNLSSGTSNRGVAGSVVAIDGGANEKYIAVGYDAADADASRIEVWIYNTSTDALAGAYADRIVISSSTGDRPVRILSDGTYFHLLWRDTSASDYYLKSYSFNGTTLTAEDSDAVSTADDVKDMYMDTDDYLYITRADDIRVYSFDGSDHTNEQDVQVGNGSTQLYGITGDGKYLFVSQDENSDNDTNSIALFEPSKVIVAQFFVVVNYTSAATTVTLADPKTVDQSHSRKIVRKNLPSGNYIVYDAGRNAKTLTLIGTETSGAYSDMDDIKTICHYGAKVTIAGLDDANFNTDYWVSDIQFSAGPGYPANMYDYTLTLEEL